MLPVYVLRYLERNSTRPLEVFDFLIPSYLEFFSGYVMCMSHLPNPRSKTSFMSALCILWVLWKQAYT